MKGGSLWAVVLLWLVAASSAAADTASFTHDANGNLTSRTEGGVEWTYAYDSRDQLREVRRDGTIVEVYQYDAQGRRVRKTGAGGIVRYVWDGDRIVAETDDFGNLIARYRYAGARIVSVEHITEGTGIYVLDALGSPVGLVRADGTLAARYRLDAWGVLRAEEGAYPNPFRFTGHQFDEATELYYAKARYYDPAAARFLTEDPAAGLPQHPPSLHRYGYAHQNPGVYTDPDGRRVATAQEQDNLRGLFLLEKELERSYQETGTFRGRAITQEEYDHALLDVRTRQESYVTAVMEAVEGEAVAAHHEDASFFDVREVARYRPVPSRERWERETQENLTTLNRYFEVPEIVGGLAGVSAAGRLKSKPTRAGQLLGEATAQGQAVIVRENTHGPTIRLVPQDLAPGFRTTLPNTPDTTMVVRGSAAYEVDASGVTINAVGRIAGSHKGRIKGYRPEPVGGRGPGDHRGHLVPEGGVANPADVNVRENMIAEARASNLGPKRSFDLLASRIADRNPGAIVETLHTPLRRQGEARPYAVTHSLVVDGRIVHTVTIPNQ